jgi:hypothetical protein
MQLEFAFLEQTVSAGAPRSDRWEKIDPNARAAAMVILSRLIAQMLKATSSGETGDE